MQLKIFQIYCFCFFILVMAENVCAIPFQDTTYNTSLNINKITISGNSKTNSSIILRELTFKEGDTFVKYKINEQIKKSKSNLLNTSLFNYVTINSSDTLTNSININIKVEERWYLWPSVHLKYADRNFSSWLKKKDLMRINYGFGITKRNFRGRNEKISFYASFGYKQSFSFRYHNISLDEKKRHLLGTTFSFQRRNEVNYGVENDREVLYKSATRYIYNHLIWDITYRFRPAIYQSVALSLKYLRASANDTLIQLNPDFFINNKKSQNIITLSSSINIDNRDYRIYPLKGQMFNVKYSAMCIEAFKLHKKYIHTLSIIYKKYAQISKRWYWASGIKGKISSSPLPYFIAEGLGYKSNSIRGYEYYIIHGGQMFLSGNHLKFKLIPQIIKKFKWIPFSKFNKIHFSAYTNLFFDAAYVYDNFNTYYNQNNSLNNRWLYTSGIGLDFLTYYDKLLQINFSINHLGETGIFIHFKAPF